MIDKLILDESVGFKDAIELLDNNGSGVLPVVDKSNKLLGLITDGDVRKAILADNLDLDHVFNKNPYKVNVNSSKAQIVSYLKKIHRRHVPLVDNNGNYIDVFTLDDLDFNLKSNWVVIMAGGLGSRLGELTRMTPKPMLKVGSKPMIEHIIHMFMSHGFTKFLISVNYMAEAIKRYFGDGARHGIKIKYLEEDTKLGTAGALSLIDFPINDPLFVANGDVISTIDYEQLLDFHNNEGSAATMCTRKDAYQIPYGVISVDEDKNVIDMHEKPIHSYLVNAGIYVLDPMVLGCIPKNQFFDMPELFSVLMEKDFCTKHYEITEYWIDVGRVSDYEKINKDFEID